MRAVDVAVWQVSPKDLADNNKDNHGISSQKFHLLREFLTLGYSVFLSDVDVAWLANPWPALARDADVEGLSDGFDERTAYGYIDGIDDPGMGWARYAQTVRIFVLNSGLFYIRPSPRTAREWMFSLRSLMRAPMALKESGESSSGSSVPISSNTLRAR